MSDAKLIPFPTSKRQPDPAPEPGVYFDVPNAKYQRWAAVQPSLLNILDEEGTPADARRWLDGATEPPSWNMMFGTAAHAALLEPKRYAKQQLAVEGLKWQAIPTTFAKHAAANPGRIILAEEWPDAIDELCVCVELNRTAHEIINSDAAASEVAVVWDDPDTGLRCKTLIDRVCWGNPACLDLMDIKTAASISPEGFGRAVWDFGYDVAMVHQINGAIAAARHDKRFAPALEQVELRYLLLRNDGVADAVVQRMAGWIDIGKQRRRERMLLLADCIATGKWPGAGRGQDEVDAAVPGWVMSKYAGGEGGGM